jgi:hypothetical protein
MKQIMEEMAIEFGYKPDKYYTAKEKMCRESLKGVAPFGRRG